MNTTPLVSIVTPTLNSGKYLLQTIESVLEQNYKNIEHIVVDGGSTDETLSILSLYPHICTIHTRTPGMYAAINLGLSQAKGDVLCYLNSDDLFGDKESILRVVEGFIKNPLTMWAYGNCDFINDTGVTIKRFVSPFFSYRLFSALNGMSICQPATFWRKQCHTAYGFFNENYRLAADFDFFLRLGKHEKPLRIGGFPLARFRVHSNSLSALYPDKSELELCRIKDSLNIKPNAVLSFIAIVIFKLCNVRRIYEKLTKFSG